MDVADRPDAERDITYIRMNVDNFDEVYDLFMAHGFTNPRGNGTIEAKSAKAATLIPLPDSGWPSSSTSRITTDNDR